MCSHSHWRGAHRSQRMEVRHPPQRKLRVSAFSAQPNHKSCQATLVSADARAHTHTRARACAAQWDVHNACSLACLFSCVGVSTRERDLGIIREPHFFLVFSAVASISTCCLQTVSCGGAEGVVVVVGFSSAFTWESIEQHTQGAYIHVLCVHLFHNWLSLWERLGGDETIPPLRKTPKTLGAAVCLVFLEMHKKERKKKVGRWWRQGEG